MGFLVTKESRKVIEGFATLITKAPKELAADLIKQVFGQLIVLNGLTVRFATNLAIFRYLVQLDNLRYELQLALSILILIINKGN